MKIIFEAWNLKSEPMEMPENLGHRFKIPLVQRNFNIVGYSGESLAEVPERRDIGEFEDTGRWVLSSDDTIAKIYKLVRL